MKVYKIKGLYILLNFDSEERDEVGRDFAVKTSEIAVCLDIKDYPLSQLKPFKIPNYLPNKWKRTLHGFVLPFLYQFYKGDFFVKLDQIYLLSEDFIPPHEWVNEKFYKAWLPYNT